MFEKEDFESLKVGDLVIVNNGGWYGRSIDRVDRLTKTQIILERSQTKFRRDSGFMVGRDSYSRGHLSIYTEEKGQQIRHRNLVRELKYSLNDKVLAKFSYEKLKELKEMVDALADK